MLRRRNYIVRIGTRKDSRVTKVRVTAPERLSLHSAGQRERRLQRELARKMVSMTVSPWQGDTAAEVLPVARCEEHGRWRRRPSSV